MSEATAGEVPVALVEERAQHGPKVRAELLAVYNQAMEQVGTVAEDSGLQRYGDAQAREQNHAFDGFGVGDC